MFYFIRSILRNLFTQRNNIDYSLTKLMGIIAMGSMTYKFILMPVPDMQSFGIGIAGILTALAAKYYVEGEQTPPIAPNDMFMGTYPSQNALAAQQPPIQVPANMTKEPTE